MSWFNRIDSTVLEYMDGLKKENQRFRYYPVKEGLNEIGYKLDLGFSCYALKIFKILDQVNTFSNNHINEWVDYLNSFQRSEDDNFVDQIYLDGFRHKNRLSGISIPLKVTLNYFTNSNFKSNKIKIENYIRAETKQTVSTLFEINNKNKINIHDFPITEEEIKNFLDNLNWSYPWSSGAQYAALCVMTKTQLTNEKYQTAYNTLENYSNKIVNNETGLYYQGQFKNTPEVINGTMKILTGFDWLGFEIHHPTKIIDFCLNYNLAQRGCDIVDVVYVLYRCSKQTEYKRKEVKEFLNLVTKKIKKHFNQDGGFSYFENLNQTHYYDLKFAKSMNQSDIHGTLLCLWALVMIMDINDEKFFKYNILKP